MWGVSLIVDDQRSWEVILLSDKVVPWSTTRWVLARIYEVWGWWGVWGKYRCERHHGEHLPAPGSTLPDTASQLPGSSPCVGPCPGVSKLWPVTCSSTTNLPWLFVRCEWTSGGTMLHPTVLHLNWKRLMCCLGCEWGHMTPEPTRGRPDRSTTLQTYPIQHIYQPKLLISDLPFVHIYYISLFIIFCNIKHLHTHLNTPSFF